jgi:hypothetical protein
MSVNNPLGANEHCIIYFQGCGGGGSLILTWCWRNSWSQKLKHNFSYCREQAKVEGLCFLWDGSAVSFWERWKCSVQHETDTLFLQNTTLFFFSWPSTARALVTCGRRLEENRTSASTIDRFPLLRLALSALGLVGNPIYAWSFHKVGFWTY